MLIRLYSLRNLSTFTEKRQKFQFLRLLCISARNVHPGPEKNEMGFLFRQGSFYFNDIQSLCIEGNLQKAAHVLHCTETRVSDETYILLLKLCISRRDLHFVRHIRAHMHKYCVKPSDLLNEHLVVALARCGDADASFQLLNTMSCSTVSVWTSVISSYAENGNGHKALDVYQWMRKKGVEANSYTFMSLLKACASVRDLEQGKQLYDDARTKGLTSNIFVCNGLVSMYGKCGAIEEAKNVFLGMNQRDSVSWSAMLSVLVQHGQAVNTLKLYRQMQEEGIHPNQHAVMCGLQACICLSENEEAIFDKGREIKVKSLEIGQALHAHSFHFIKKWQSDILLCTSLFTMYRKCGAFDEAISIFSAMPHHDVASWTSMLSLLVEQSQAEEALILFRLMQQECTAPNQHTFVIAIHACDILAQKEKHVLESGKEVLLALIIGKALHADARKKGYATDVHVGTSLINMYSNCGTVLDAEDVFKSIQHHDIISWNKMLSTYAEHNQPDKALSLYRQMQEGGLGFNEPTLVIVLKACATLIEDTSPLSKNICYEIVVSLHSVARQKGYMSNTIIVSSFLNLYAKCGTILDVESVFSALIDYDTVTCCCMILAYIEQGQADKAIYFYRTKMESVALDDVVILSVLRACKETCDLEICEKLHNDIISAGFDKLSSLSSGLITAYGGCNSTVNAEAIVDSVCIPDIISWTACVTGKAGNGDYIRSLYIFEQLRIAGYNPNEVTFTSALSACCHTGLVKHGLWFFDSMTRDYCVVPEKYHYVVIIDLLARAGDFSKVESILRNNLIKDNILVWLCILGACQTHGNVELANIAFNHAIQLEPRCDSAYVFFSNICADELSM